MSTAALVMAAGSGVRFGAPKQFAELTDGVRLVDGAVRTALAVADWVAVVLPAGRSWDGAPVDLACAGGASRQASIAAGLARVPPSMDVVVVHSASHPLASTGMARAVVEAVEAGADGAVPLLDLVDVLKRHERDRLMTVGREGFGLAQSPMAFSRDRLDAAFAAGVEAIEESQLIEASGGRVVAVAGEATNVHVVDGPSLAVVRAIAAAAIVV